MEDYLNFDQMLEQVEIDLMTPIEALSEPAQYDGEIVPPDVIQKLKDKPPYIDEMMAKIEEMDEYAQNRGSMGLDFGIQSLNQAFNGLNPGLTLLAGSANSGKSMLLLEIMRRVITNNQYQDIDHPKKAYCMYFSLDDSNNELMPRLIASDQKIRINDALFPKTLANKPVVQEKRRVGVENLKANAKYFSMHDALEGQSIQQIERTLSRRYQELEMIAPGEYQIVVFIDNFHDLSYETDGFMEDNQKFDFISGRLNELAIEYNVPVLCSAEFRKISTLKRPTEDDIKSTGKIAYEAKGIILLYNEVGIKGDNSDIYWNMGSHDGSEDRKMPVLEMHISKNKFNSFKGRCFLKFMPEMASFYEASDEEEQSFRQMMRG